MPSQRAYSASLWLSYLTDSLRYHSGTRPSSLCRLVIVDESVKPAVSHHYTIKNRIDYY
ncbi:YnfC family lipoprotein [Salmonella enterica]|nr:YnfC family lipoprotein [Salmonella enterica]